MTRDGSPLSRRAVLASLGGAGALAGAAGKRTVASFGDGTEVAGSLRAGRVEIDVDCDGCVLEDGRLELALESVAPGESRVKTVRLAVPEGANPARLWLRTECPPVSDPLGEDLESRLSVRRDCEDEGEAERLVPPDEEWTSLSELRRKLRDGVRLDDPTDSCPSPGEPRCLEFEYRLPDDATWTVDAETDLVVELFARQCRHVPEEDVSNPFPEEDCPEPTCPECVELGKLEVENDRLDPGVYDFDEVYGDVEDGEDGSYRLEVLTVTDKVDDGERETVCASVRLLKNGRERDAPAICEVTVKGGRPTVTYDVDPPLTRTRGEVCASRDPDDPETESDGERPAISNLTVSVCPDGVSDDG